jgi:hypothetical protein
LIPNEEMNRLLEISKIGDDLKNFKEEGGYAILQKYILDPFEKEAFEAFQDVIATDVDSVIETQMMGKIVRRIRQAIEIKINEGMLAKSQLKNNSEGEYDT